jgi:hypothetical protein
MKTRRAASAAKDKHMTSPKLSEVYGHEEAIVSAIEEWVNGDMELGSMTAYSGRCIEEAGRTLRNRIDRAWLDLDENDLRQKITKRIKQISPVEPGWTFQYLVEDIKDGTFFVMSTPVMGQALVERTFWDDTVSDDIEFVILVEDDPSLCLTGDAGSCWGPTPTLWRSVRRGSRCGPRT